MPRPPSDATALPLRYRLPNAPPLFVGRADEGARLAAMVRRAPVTVVCGLGGLGKTSLVLHTLHEAFAEGARRALFVGLRPADPPADATVEIMRALAASHGLATVEWAGLLGGHEALLQTLIDQAEARAQWVVLDDFHHAHPGRAREALAALARYARDSRWIVTSRLDPDVAELADQTLLLGGMAPDDLDDLAARCAPTRSAVELRQAAIASAGSPWHLRQALAGGDLRGAAAGLLGGLSPQAAGLLRALALLDLPLAPRALEAVAPLPPDDELASLERRGLVERGAGGLRLHDVARPLVDPGEGARARKEALALALAGADDPAAALESLRLWLDLGRVDDAAALLEARFELMASAGLIPRLRELLAPLERPRVAGFKLRCAVALGDAAALDAATLPEPPSLGDRFFWALSHFLRGRLGDAAALAAAVRRDAPPALAFEAGVFESACLGEQGYAGEALAVLDSLAALASPGSLDAPAPPGSPAALASPGSLDAPDAPAPVDPNALAVYAVHRARWLAQQGRVDEAMTAVDWLLTLALDPEGPAAREVREELVVVLCFLGRVRKLRHALSALALAAPLGPAALFGFRRALLTEVLLGVHEGRLDEARAIFREVKPITLQTAYLRSFVCALDVELRLVAGELGGLPELLATLHAEASHTGHAQNRNFAVMAAYRLAVLRGSPHVALAGPSPPVTPFWAALCAAYARLHATLHGLEAPPAPALAEAVVHGRVVSALTRAAERALAGDAGDARAHAASALAAAREHGNVPGELEAQRALCDTLLLAGAGDELDRAADELRARGEATGSRRFAAEALWFTAVRGGSPHPAELEPIAQLVDVAPVAARRARALLGEPAELDRLDHAVLLALSPRPRQAVRRVAEGASDAPERAGWGLDTVAQKVWLPGGRTVCLATRPLLYRLLLALAERGGRATKEEIVVAAWQQRDYHPVRDDKRLQVAMRKLRLLVEDDPSCAARLVTTPQGYAFGANEPFRLLAADER